MVGDDWKKVEENYNSYFNASSSTPRSFCAEHKKIMASLDSFFVCRGFFA